MIRRLLPALLIAALSAGCASAQSTAQPSQMGYLSTSGCPAGQTVCFVQYGPAIPITGTISASLGGFRPTAYGTPIAATTGGVTGTLPANTGQVVATNVGTTNGAYCALGASATTSSQFIAPNGGWFGFAISGDTQLTCITASSTTTVNLAGGSGLPTGTGGGGGGSSSITNYALESTGNLEAAAASLAAIQAALGSPIPSNKPCQTTVLASSLVCGSPAVALIDFSVNPDATLAASGYNIIIVDQTGTAPTSPATVVYRKCYTVPSSFGQTSYGANFGAGGVTLSSGLTILISTGVTCQSYIASVHAVAIMADFQ
jgi:hypothetical protein